MNNFLSIFPLRNITLIYYLSILRDLVLLLQFLIFLVYLIIIKKTSQLKFFTLCLVIGFIIAFIIPLVINYQRPLTYYLNLNYFSPSFPSKHVMVSTFMTLFSMKLNPILFLISFLFLITISFLSWLSLLHWPVDIVGGFILAWLVFYILNLFQRFNFQNFKNKGEKIFQENDKS